MQLIISCDGTILYTHSDLYVKDKLLVVFVAKLVSTWRRSSAIKTKFFIVYSTRRSGGLFQLHPTDPGAISALRIHNQPPWPGFVYLDNVPEILDTR